MESFGLSNRTKMLVTANQLKKSIEQFKSKVTECFNPNDQHELYNYPRGDGCSVLTSLLEFHDFEKYKIQYAYTFLWYIEFNPEWAIPADDVLSNWLSLSDDTLKDIIQEIKASSHTLITLKSLQYLYKLVSASDDQLSTVHLESLFLDFYGFLTKDEDEAYEKQYVRLKELLRKSDYPEGLYIDQELESLQSILDELNQMIGLTSVKEEVYNLVDFIKVNQLRQARGLPVAAINLHSVFLGPAGTGKTTVARLMAKAYKALGILNKGHLVEIDRSGLVAGYVGQTAIKTKEVLDMALDGVLFIDEVYMLSAGDTYGQEAIDTILKYMEDYRERLIIIAAGYEKEMQTFLKINPGLQSRFNKFIYFPGYSSTELLEIACSMLTGNGFIYNETVKTKLIYLINDAIHAEGSSFGNARFVRNLYERILQNQFKRISRVHEPTTQDLCQLLEEDVC